MKTEFAALVAELETLAKSEDTTGDAAIAAAAGEAPAAGATEEDPEGEGQAEGSVMAKSFMLKLEDGTEVPAIDGADLIKSLTDRVEANEASTLRALGMAVNLIKSLQDRVGKLSAAPTPRKTVLSISERPAAITAAAAQPQGIESDEFMAKAFALQCEGKLTGRDVAMAEAAIHAGQQPPASITSVVMAK